MVIHNGSPDGGKPQRGWRPSDWYGLILVITVAVGLLLAMLDGRYFEEIWPAIQLAFSLVILHHFSIRENRN